MRFLAVVMVGSALLLAGCGRYYPMGVNGPHAPAAAVRSEVTASPTDSPSETPTPDESPSPSDSPAPSPTAEPTTIPVETPVPTAEPTAIPTAEPTATPAPTPSSWGFTWSGSGSGTSPQIMWPSPGGYWADLSFTCTGTAPSVQWFEWYNATGTATGSQSDPYHLASFSEQDQHHYIHEGSLYGGRYLHIEATPDCSWSEVFRQV